MEQSVSELFELYLERSDLRPNSIRFKRRALKYFIEWFGDIPVGRVNPAIAEDYRTLLAKGRSKSSANGYFANFKPFWEWLFRHDRIDSNPFNDLRLYRTTVLKREVFSSLELSRILRIASRLWRVRICLGLLGMRRGEMLNVCECDINLSATLPHILLCPKKATRNTWLWEIKDYSTRMIALPEMIYFDDILVRLHEDIISLASENNQPYICIEPKYYEKLMCWQREEKDIEQYTADPTGNFQRMFRSLQKRAGINPTKCFKDLRASFATILSEVKGIEVAAKALGHSSIETTRRHYNRKSDMSLVSDMGQVAEKCYQTRVP